MPARWAAGADRPGVNFLPDLTVKHAKKIKDTIDQYARPGDVVVLSVHWGDNWGYEIPRQQIDFAHRVIDEARVDIVHGHSSHHVKGLEIYHDRLILYGCGDFINDYEGIRGHEAYRPDLALMYFPTVNASTGALKQLRLAPMQVRRFRVNHASERDTIWLRDRLNRESERFGVRVRLQEDGFLVVENE